METKTGKIRVAKTKGGREEEERRKEIKRKGTRQKRKKPKKERTIEVKKVAEKWEIWDEEEEVAKSEEEVENLVPEQFNWRIHVFGKKVSKRILTKKLWDHVIEIKKEFVPRKRKVYLLLRKERGEMHEFIEEQLRKGYIRPLKSSQIALVFFIGKKNGKKRMVQNYWYLNEWTIKNNYPLPLISDIVENISMKKVFTKLDLRWGYNNAWIKKKDEWKTAFTIPEGSFKPMVMFFRLTIPLVMFQIIMNEIL